MNKSELIDAITERLGDKKTAGAAVEALVDTITRSVSKGEKVAIAGFGVFEKQVRNARTARNPATGATIRLKKTAVPKFRPGAGFKDIVSGAKKLAKASAPAKAASGTAGRTAAPAKATKGTSGTTTRAATTRSAAGASATGRTTGTTRKTATTSAAPAKATRSTAKKSATTATAPAKATRSTAKKSATTATAPAKATRSTAKKAATTSAAKKTTARKSTR